MRGLMCRATSPEDPILKLMVKLGTEEEMGIRRGRKGLGTGRLGLREEGAEDRHLSHSSVPVACGQYVALDYDGSSGSKAPLQFPHIWHRLWEENMGSHHLSGHPPEARCRDKCSERGPYSPWEKPPTPVPCPTLTNKSTLISLPAPNILCPLYFLSSRGSLWIGAP